MADVKQINGYMIKDETARGEIDSLKTRATALEGGVSEAKNTSNTASSTAQANASEIAALKNTVGTHTTDINGLKGRVTNLEAGGGTSSGGGVSFSMNYVAEYETPEEYSTPASGESFGTFFGKVTKGLSNIFSRVKTSYSAIMETDGPGHYADAYGVKEGFSQIEADIVGLSNDIEGIAEQIGEAEPGGGLVLDKIWENSNPTVSFTPKTVTVPNMDGYSFLMFMFKFRCSNGQQMTQIMPNVDNMGTIMYYMTNNKYGRRIAKRVDATTLQFETGSYDGSDNNEYGVPVVVYGVTLNIKDRTM